MLGHVYSYVICQIFCQNHILILWPKFIVFSANLQSSWNWKQTTLKLCITCVSLQTYALKQKGHDHHVTSKQKKVHELCFGAFATTTQVIF
jgi:hypothetical protein